MSRAGTNLVVGGYIVGSVIVSDAFRFSRSKRQAAAAREGSGERLLEALGKARMPMLLAQRHAVFQ